MAYFAFKLSTLKLFCFPSWWKSADENASPTHLHVVFPFLWAPKYPVKLPKSLLNDHELAISLEREEGFFLPFQKLNTVKTKRWEFTSRRLHFNIEYLTHELKKNRIIKWCTFNFDCAAHNSRFLCFVSEKQIALLVLALSFLNPSEGYVGSSNPGDLWIMIHGRRLYDKGGLYSLGDLSQSGFALKIS